MTAAIVMHRSRQPQTRRYIEREWSADDEWFGLDEPADGASELWSRVAEGRKQVWS
ncbi:hypothetical protein [Curtobacterium sp. MCBD17_030]|uniref:hypothetical protein n=1 Tax=Curtobacterium sp. MCBD17_030 TaxID=2175649 RepID=UPI0015E89406|nr:hypothetical protein [Curtobacterium sp. MCBD17_030]